MLIDGSNCIVGYKNEIINNLKDREKEIILLRFYKDKTQTEVAEEIGISQAQVSRLEKSALSKIRYEIQ